MSHIPWLVPLIAALAIIAILLAIQPKEEIMPKGNGGTTPETLEQFYKDLSGQCALASVVARFVIQEHLQEFVNHVQTEQQEKGYPVVFPKDFIVETLTSLPDEMHSLANMSARMWLR